MDKSQTYVALKKLLNNKCGTSHIKFKTSKTMLIMDIYICSNSIKKICRISIKFRTVGNSRERGEWA